MRFFRSLLCALQGIGYGIRQERHVRVHLTAAFYVLAASFFFSFSPTQYAILFLIMGVVVALELVNTALERVVDEISMERRHALKVIKDVAAGAVLIAALAAVAIAAALFWQSAGWERMFAFFAVQPWRLVLLAAVFVGSLLFILKGGTSNQRKK
ncbi:MAG: diacylglycerol kinase family protein [Clostridiales bacterium]|nr:diacylglycerol kinase family protein [Clostridiales bacterium]